MPSITVDGRAIECADGELVIAAARRSGIYIPHFCWHSRMDPIGACRMCLVHLEGGPPKPQTSCTTQVKEGMVVQTQFTNEAIRTAQEGVLEFLLINHPLDCPICDRGGECPLQDQTQDYGPNETRFIEAKRRFVKPVRISPLVALDRERCILCFRCTRFCEELSGDTMISTMDRGAQSYIFPFEGKGFDSYFSGNTIEICPVGALTSTSYRFRARPWDLKRTPSVCNLCASGCNVDLSVRIPDGSLVRVSQATNEDVNEEWLCDKGRFGHAYISSPSRITQPWIRRNGELEAVSWDEVLKELAGRIEPLLATPESLAVLTGASLCDEDAYAAAKFARLTLGTNSVDYRLDGGPSPGNILGSVTYDELLSSGHVVVVGIDLREELPLVFLRLRIAAARGKLKLTFVNPRRVAGSDLGEIIQPLPGTYAAVASALCAAAEKPLTAGIEILASMAGLVPGAIRSVASSVADSPDAIILLGASVASDRDCSGAWNAAAGILGARIAWAPRRAGENGALAAGAHPEFLPGWRQLSDPVARAEVEKVWGAPIPETPGRSAIETLKSAAAGSIELMWLVGADVLDVADARLGSMGLYGAKYVVIQDVQSDDQVEFADVILPGAAFAERAGTLTNWEGRRQQVSQVVDPPGSARADYAILSEVARRLGRLIGTGRLKDVQAELDALLRPVTPEVTTHVATVAPHNDRDFPLRLETYRLLYDSGSRVRHSEGIAALTESAFCEVHPDDASEFADGQSVRVVSRYGSITCSIVITPKIVPGAVFVPYAQPKAGARELLSIDDPAVAVRVEGI